MSTVLPSSVCDRPDQLDELGHVLHRDARHRLVEQEHPLVGGEEHCELELALVPVRQQPGRPPFTLGEPDPPDRPGRTFDRVTDGGGAPPDLHRAAHRGLRRQAHVLVRRQQREDVRDLERAADPGLRTPVRRLLRDVDPVELDGAARGPAQTGDEVEECRLPRPVRADHGKELTVEDLELDIGDDGGAADVESELPRSEDWGCSHAFEATFGSSAASSGRQAVRCRTSSPYRSRCRRDDRLPPSSASPGTSAAASRDPAA